MVDPSADKQRTSQSATRGIPSTLPVVVIVSLISLFLVAPFAPTGFVPLLPALPVVARWIFLEHRWRREVQELIGPNAGR